MVCGSLVFRVVYITFHRGETHLKSAHLQHGISTLGARQVRKNVFNMHLQAFLAFHSKSALFARGRVRASERALDKRKLTILHGNTSQFKRNTRLVKKIIFSPTPKSVL